MLSIDGELGTVSGYLDDWEMCLVLDIVSHVGASTAL